MDDTDTSITVQPPTTPLQPDKDLQTALTLGQTPQVEAAQNIDRSNLFDISPDSYAGLKDHLGPLASATERIPADAGPVTKDFATQSEQHASLAGPDIQNMSWLEQAGTYLKNKLVTLPDLVNQQVELSNKEVTDGTLSPGDREQLNDVNTAVNQINQQNQSLPSLGSTFKFGAEVAGGVEDFGRAYYQNKALLGTSIATGAGLGALSASFIPVPGLSTAAGAFAGGVEGAVTGSTLIGFVDGYQRTRGLVNNELSQATDATGKPLNISQDTRAKVSQGVALISGVAQGFAGKIIAQNNPLLQRFASPQIAAQLLASSPATLAQMEILGGVAKSALAQGGATALGTLTKIIGENFAKIDDTEESFTNALHTAVSQAMNTDTLKQVGASAAQGAATGAVISGTLGALGKGGLEDRFTEAQKAEQFKQYRAGKFADQFNDFQSQQNYASPEQAQQYQDTKMVNDQRSDVLETQNNTLEMANYIKDTGVQKYAPQEMNAFTKKVFSTLGMGDDFFVNLDTMREFADSPEKAAAVRSIIDPNGQMTKMAQQLNTPIPVAKADVVQMATKFPDITDHIKLTPDGESPLEARTNAQDFADKLTDAASKRQDILSNLGVDQPATPEVQQQLADLKTLAVDDKEPYTGKNDYLDSQSFAPIPGVMTQEEVDSFNSTHAGAMLDVANSLKEDVDNHFEKINNRIFKDVDSKDIQNDIVRLDSEFKVLDNFSDTTKVNAQTVEHEKKGFSPSAIDPNSLPEDLKEVYWSNPVLAKRKVFVKGGMDLEESAAMNGVDSGADLLRILAETPSRNAIKQGREQRQIELRNRIEQTTKPAKLNAREAAFSNKTDIHIKEGEYLRSKEWPTLKRGIIKIATPSKSAAELNNQAKETVSQMKISQLNPTQFKVGESNSQKAALKNYLNSEFEQAFANKQKAALNNEMRREVINASEKVAGYQRFWKSVNTPGVQQELKDAGYLDAMNEFTSVYRLDGAIKNATEQNSFNNYIKNQVESGNYTPYIPPRLDNAQTSYKDLTVDQYQAITEVAQTLVDQAKTKNELLTLGKERAEFRTAETTAKEIETTLKQHPDYNLEKAKVKDYRNSTFTERIATGVSTGLSVVSSFKSIIEKLDNYQPNGLFHQLIGEPFKAARNNERQLLFEIEKTDRQTVQEYGQSKLNKLSNTWVHVPEFEGMTHLGNGKGDIRKVDLFALQAYRGDPTGRESFVNYINQDGKSLSTQDMENVLNRELDHKDAAFVQKFLVDRWEKLKQPSFDLHKRTTGEEPEMIEGVPFTHTVTDAKGNSTSVEMKGGYYPIKRKMLTVDMKAMKFFEQTKALGTAMFGGDKENHFFSEMRASERTKQGRLKDRTGSNRALDANFENFIPFTSEAVHDLSFREVGIDALKILKNPINTKNMQAVIGQEKFLTFLDHTKDIVSKTSERESTIHAQEHGWVNNTIQTLHTVQAVRAIGFNIKSSMIHTASLTTLSMRMGPMTPVYIMKAAQKIISNISHLNNYEDLAGDINPDIKSDKEGIDQSLVKQSYDFILPASNTFFDNYKTGSGQTMATFKNWQNKAVNASFVFIRKMDHFNRTLATNALSEQFLNGDVQGYSKVQVDAMTEADRAKTLRSVVQQAIDLSLPSLAPEDKTSLEKIKAANIVTRYWSIERNMMNTLLAQGDKIKGNLKQGKIKPATTNLLWMAACAGVGTAIINAVRGNKEAIQNKLHGESKEDFAKDMLWDFIKAPVDETLGSIPGVNNVKYSAGLDSRSDYKQVNFPLTSVLSDFATGMKASTDFLKMATKSTRKQLGMNTSGEKNKLSNVQVKTLLVDAGYLLSAPSNSIMKGIGLLESSDAKKTVQDFKDDVTAFNKEANSFINAFKDKPQAQPFINDLKEYQKTIPQFDNDVKKIIPPNAESDIKQIISKGEWDHLDPQTGASGIYGFTKERWDQIMTLNPNLGLTDNGRVSQNTQQQEKAMNWSIQDDTRGLMAYDIPVETKNLLGAHQFGFDNYAAIFKAPDDEKLSKAIGKEASTPVFEKFETVKQVKDYLSREVNKNNQ